MKYRLNQFSMRELLVAFIWFSVAFWFIGICYRELQGSDVLLGALWALPLFGAGIGYLFGETITGFGVGIAATLAATFLAILVSGIVANVHI